MKTGITQHLLRFGLAALVLTFLFRFALSTSITKETIVGVVLSAVLYAASMWTIGKYFGQKDYEQLPIFDIGFRFHLATFLIHNLVSIAWFLLDLQSHYEDIQTIYYTAGVWSIFLLFHLYYYLSIRKSSIKNLDKEDLFE